MFMRVATSEATLVVAVSTLAWWKRASRRSTPSGHRPPSVSPPFSSVENGSLVLCAMRPGLMRWPVQPNRVRTHLLYYIRDHAQIAAYISACFAPSFVRGAEDRPGRHQSPAAIKQV